MLVKPCYKVRRITLPDCPPHYLVNGVTIIRSKSYWYTCGRPFYTLRDAIIHAVYGI